MTSANIQHKNTFLNWGISIAIGIGLSAGLSATASYDVSTIAGSSVSFSGDGGISTAARLNNPYGIFVDSSSNVYFADTDNHRIRMLIATAGTYFGVNRVAADIGKIYTIAGTGTAGFSGDGAAATGANLNLPRGVFVDNLRNVYIADTNSNRIRMVVGAAGTYFGVNRVPADIGKIYTIAGGNVTNSGFAGDGGSATATSVRLSSPRGIFVDSSNNVYIADTNNNRIRMVVGTAGTYFGVNRVTADIGKIYTIAGTGTAGSAGDNGAATGANLNLPRGVFVDNLRNVYIADTNSNRIRMVVGAAGTYFGVNRVPADIGKIYTIAGGNVTNSGFAGDGGSATATSVRLSSPRGIFVDSSNNVYIADSNNNRIRMVVGTAGTYFGVNRVAVDIGKIYTIAGTGTAGFLDGSATSTARLHDPQGVFVNASGDVYIAEGINNRIRMLTASSNSISTIAGGFGDGGLATAARLNAPRGICRDSAGNTYIAESGNGVIRKIDGTGIISSFISSGLNIPFGVCADSSGNIYVSNFGNGTIGKYSNTGSVINASFISGLSSPYGICLDSADNLYVGNWGNSTLGKYSSTGSVINAGFISGLNGPTGVYVDSSGSIYVVSSNNGRLGKYSSTGTVINASLISGMASPNGVCLDAAGNVYVGDTGNTRVQRLSVSDNSISTIASGLNAIYGLCIDNLGNVYVSENGNNRIRKLLSKLTVSGGGTLSATATGTAYIQGGGTAVLPASNSISAVEVNNGTLQVSSSAPITFNASGGSAIVEILAAINTGAFTFNTPGAVKIATGIAAILDAPSGSGTMSKTGAGRLRAIANLSSSSTPVAVSEGILEVSGTGRLPNAATSVASGATLQLGTSGGTVASGAVANASVASGGIMSILAGATGAVTSATIASGGVLSVAAGVTAPNGMFTSATFRSGGILQVGDGATLGQSFNSVA